MNEKSENTGSSFDYQLKKLHVMIPLSVFKALQVTGHLYVDLDTFVARAIAQALVEAPILAEKVSVKKKPRKKAVAEDEAI
jgi:hypothetical protein